MYDLDLGRYLVYKKVWGYGVIIKYLLYLVNFIIPIYSQSCSFVEPSLTTYSTESSDFRNYEIHSIK